MGSLISRSSRASRLSGSRPALTNSDRVNVVRPPVPEHVKGEDHGHGLGDLCTNTHTTCTALVVCNQGDNCGTVCCLCQLTG